MLDEATLATLPGGEFLGPGLEDLRSGTPSIEALLLLIGRSRLRAAGIDVPTTLALPPDGPELALYALLQREHGDEAHSRYNALIRRLVSLERALECAS